MKEGKNLKGKFENKTVFITGGASGIGKETALMFAAEGANIVIVTSTIIDKAEALAEHIKSKFCVGAIGIKCDVRKETDVASAVARAVENFGTLDIAFNNAGVGPDGVTIPLVPLTELTERDWNWVLDVDLTGVFFCLKHELRQMQKQRRGNIVCTASTAGLRPMGNFGAYGPAKAGLIQLTKAAAVENREFGIRCNIVCPGPTMGTGMADRMFGTPEQIAERKKSAPTGAPPGLKMGVPADVAKVVLWLCSEEAGHVNGNVITADGGLDIL
jgi:NAD(P)-dependent dehydrogenase (short-subunit alcohol dehydrogenase family)